jgi:hypothetical protein
LGVRDARFKLVMRIEPGAVEEVYNLEADPGETHPVPITLAITARKRLLRAAFEHVQKTVSVRDPVLRLQARLRDLRLELESKAS